MTTVADIQAKLTADTAQFSSAFNEAQRLTESFTGKLGGLEGVLAKGFTIAAIAKVGQAIFEATERAGKFAEQLEQISTITGVSTSSLQDWGVVLNRVGMGIEDVAGMTRILSRNIEEAKNGTQSAIDKFDNLGISIKETSGSEEVIRKIADSMSHMGSATERAATATELLGRGGQRAINFLVQGSAAFDQAATAAARMGKLTEDQIASLSKTDDALDDLGKSWEGLSNQIGAIFAPAVKVAAQALTFVLNETQVAIQKVWLRFQDLLNGVNSFAQQVLNIGKGIFSGEIFSSAGRDAISERAKAIINEESAVRDLIRADHELVGTAEQYKKATNEKTVATQSASSALKEYRRAVELAIEIDQINSEERIRQMKARDQAFGNSDFFDEPFRPLNNPNVQTLTDRDLFERARPNASFVGPMPGQPFYDSFGINARNQAGLGVAIRTNTISEVQQASAMQARIFEQITAQMNEASGAGQALGNAMRLDKLEMENLTEAMEASAQAAPLSEFEELAEKSRRLGSINADWINQLGVINSKQLVLGSTYDSTNDKITALQTRMMRLVQEGVSPTSDEFKRMQEELKPLEDQKKLTDAIHGVFDSVNQAFDTVVQGVLLGTQTMSQAIKRLGVDIAASLGKELIAKPITKALEKMITESMASGLLSKAGSFASGLLPAGVTAGGLGMAAGIGGGVLGIAALAGAFSGGSRGRDFLEGVANIWTFGLADAFDAFGGDERNRKRNEIDFLHGTQQAAKDWLARISTANTPAQLQAMMMNGDLPGEHGGSFGTITSSFAPGGIMQGRTIGFQSIGAWQHFGGLMSESATQFVKAIQDSVDLIVKAFNDANEKIVSQLVGLAMQTATQATTSQEFLLKRTQINRAIQQQIDSAHADMIGMTDPTQLSAQVNKIQTLLQQRYNGEVQMVQAFVGKIQQSIAAWKGLTSTIDEQLSGLRLNRFGAPTPEAQFAFDQSRFSSALTSFRGSRTASAGAMVSDLASPLLTAAAALAGGDMTSSSYQATWQTVVNALEEVRNTSIDETTKLNNDMLAALGEQTTLENLIQQNTKRMADSLDNLRLEASSQFRAMGFNIPQFAEGTDFVPKTGLAVVHRGEEIVPVGGRSSRGVVIQVSGNTFVGTEQSMLRDLASKIQPYINSNPSL